MSNPQTPSSPAWVTPDGSPPIRGTAVWDDTAIPKFMARGVEYTFRPLGWRDATKLYTLVEDLIAWGSNSSVLKFGSLFRLLRDARVSLLGSGEDGAPSVDSWLLLLVAPLMGIREVEDDVVHLLERLIVRANDKAPLTAGQLSDPNLFPMDTLPLALAAFGGHPDLLSFFTSCGVVRHHPMLQTLMVNLKNHFDQTLLASTDGKES